MIVKARDGQKREFMGVPFVLLATGEKSMVAKMHYRTGVRGARDHSHMNEQSGYVISGQYRLRIVNEDTILQAGDSYSIPGNVIHSFEWSRVRSLISLRHPEQTSYSQR